MLYIDTIFIR